VVVDRNWLEPLLDIMKNKEVAVVQPKILMMQDKKRIDSVGHFIDILTFTVQIGYGDLDVGQFEKPRQIFGANGSVIFIRKKIFFELQGFDPNFFMYFEESDFCWRVWLSGNHVVYIPNSIVFHYSGGLTESTQIHTKKLFYFFRNRFYSMAKNLEWYNLIIYLPTSLLLRLFLFFFTKNKKAYGINYVKAIISMLINVRLILIKRQELVKKVTNADLLRMKVLRSFNLIYLLQKKGF
jgi:GT2 family glycosyltransferase